MSAKQTHTFQAEIPQLLNLMVNSLYSNKEIFLRELISNAADAIDRLKFESLLNDKLIDGKKEFQIYVEVDESAGTIAISDNGIGMTEAEINKNIGTIANSGTKKFLKNLDSKQVKDSNFIGQFGVGFYSAFIVSEKVSIITKKAGSKGKKGTKWISTGKGKYSTETVDCEQYGTKVTLHLKKDEKDFLQAYKLRSIITKYSDHITVPILMQKTSADNKEIEFETINKATAFWVQDKQNLKQKDYAEFYKSLTYDFADPLSYIHNKVEGSLEYISLLFIPSKAPFDIYEPKRKGGVKLYSKRVFIMEDNENLMPLYLRFVRGVIDTADLALNISREILQKNKVVDTIRKASVKRVLSELAKMANNKPQDYAVFWKELGMVLKEGMVEDYANKNKIAELLRFTTNKSTSSEQTVSLKDYMKNMQKEQKAIYYITADTYNEAKGSPHLEVFKQKDIEVLLLSNRIDEWLVSHFTEFEKLPLKSIAKGGLEDLDSTKEKTEKKKITKDFADVIKKIEEVLANKIKKVTISNRLHKSPSCLVADENEMGSNMERIMKSMGQDIPDTKPILEINPNHLLVKRLKNNIDENLIKILFDQAVLSEGGKIKDPAEFISRMNELIVGENKEIIT